jgi:hypothetical protein
MWHTKYIVDDGNEHDATYNGAVRVARGEMDACLTAISAVVQELDDAVDPDGVTDE